MKPDIVAIIEHQEKLAQAGGQLQQDRIDAMDAYLGRPYGDEEEGRSTVVMRDVADTIGWMMPSLMKVFCSGDDVCVFNPIGPEDEPQAEQETDYCNHVLMQKNQGALILHDWFHDALLEKNGYVLVSMEEAEAPQKEKYDDLTDDEFALLLQSPDVQIIEHTPEVDEATGMVTHDVVAMPKGEYPCVRVMNIPPERVAVAADWPHVSLEGCPFVRIEDWKTISELRAEGFDVDDDIVDDSDEQADFSFQNRRVTEDNVYDEEDQGADKSMRRVRVRYVWMRHDADGDGKAELHRYVVVGKTILDDEEDALIPVAACTPYRIPHEHNGQSVHDIVGDIQRIRTALIRGFLDNMYLVNNPRHAIDASMVNLDDMLVSRPGGVVRVNGQPGTAIQPLVHPADGGSILSAVEYVDTVRENRTGVTKYNQGLDANSLNKTAHGIQQVMSASQQRIELVARILAETGLRQLMLIIRAVTMKGSRQAEMVKLRGKWVPVDPSQWRSKRDITVSVGIGTGNKDQMLQHLQMILMAQKEALPLGITGPKQIYNALSKLTQNAGFKMPDEFWTDPEQNPMPPGGPSPEQVKADADMQKTQLQLQADQQKTQAQAMTTAQLKQMELEAQAIEKERDRELEREKLQIQAATQIELARIAHESQMVAKQADQQAQMAQVQDQRMHESAAEEQRRMADMQAHEAKLQPIIQGIAQITEAMNQPLAVVRGESGVKVEPVGGATKVDGVLQQILKIAEQLSKPTKVVRGPGGVEVY